MLERKTLEELRSIVRAQLPTTSTQEARGRAQQFLDQEVISSPAFSDLPFDDGRIWTLGGPRSQQRYIHGFLFFADWFKSTLADESTAADAARAAWCIVESWQAIASDRAHAPAMAYHDETTAQRLINLLSLEPFIQRHVPQHSGHLRALMQETADLLASDDFHATGNNHGMFQDLALLYYAVLASQHTGSIDSPYFDIAMSRLRAYFRQSFTADGVHVENTPTYHVMVCRQVAKVRRIAIAVGHPDERFYRSLLKRATAYATHALMPDGRYPPVSDTHQLKVSGSAPVFKSPEFLFASTKGRRGRVPQERFLLLPRSGYAIYRDRWGDENATYAFFSAAYNADYHKHADDLSFFLRSGGVDLLSEAGPYGYDYQHPLSRYGYSQFAHNSLIVDDSSLPRTDRSKDKVGLDLLEQRADGFIVEGRNARYDDVVHTRRLIVDEARGTPQFDIIDSVTASAEHHYQLLWNLGPEVAVVLHGQGFELFHEGRKLMDLMIDADAPTTLELHEGVMKPKPLGWRFPRFGEAVPAKVVSISFRAREAKVRTRIRLAEFNYLDRGLCSPDSEWSRFTGEVPVNYLFRPAVTAGGRKRMVVVFSAIHQPGDFTYNYKATVDELDVSALYILDDFGNQGAYYHSDHRSDAIFRSVQALICDLCEENGISFEDVATAGSSKGATAALIHGATLGAGRIILGAPQTKIGSFVSVPHPNILSFMAGGTTSEDIAYLDEIVPTIAKRLSPPSRVSILVGKNDHHLPNHIVPLMETLAAHGASLPSLTVLPDLSHADIGSVYRLYLAANLKQWLSGSIEDALPYSLTRGALDFSIRLRVHAPEHTKLAYRLFRGKELVQRRGYSDRSLVVFGDLPPGQYRLRVYYDVGESVSAAFTTRWIAVETPGT